MLNIKCPCQPCSPIACFTLAFNQLTAKIVALSWPQQAKKGSFRSYPIIGLSPFHQKAWEKGHSWPSRFSTAVALSPVHCLSSWSYLQMPRVWRQAAELQQKYGKVSWLWSTNLEVSQSQHQTWRLHILFPWPGMGVSEPLEKHYFLDSTIWHGSLSLVIKDFCF